MKHSFSTLLILLSTVLFVVGCGSSGAKVVPVSGTITQNGQPLPNVNIEFNKVDTGAMSFAESDSQGRFTLTHTHGKSGAEPGKYRVVVFKKGTPIPLPAGTKLEDIPEEQRDQTTPNIPITNSDNSPIEVEITESSNNIVIDIK